MARSEVLAAFDRVVGAPETFLVGAAIGTGLMARAAERGGADFLLALNAGRFRMMGAPSLASMLPLRASNSFVADFATSEILTQTSLPVFFGVNAMDPALDMKGFVDQIANAGFAGIANFPTSIHYPASAQTALELAGFGYSREMALIETAREAGLIGCAYAHNRAQADRAVEAGADLICLNVGWNAGGSSGHSARMTIDQVAEMAREIAGRIHRRGPGTICLLEGGPIVEAEHLARVCRESQINGYLGGSTLDRVPLETSVSDRTHAFKLAALLMGRLSSHDAELRRFGREGGLLGGSEAMLGVLRQARGMAGADTPALLTGEPGSGRSLVAEAIHRGGARRHRDLTILSAKDLSEVEMAAALFGRQEVGEGARRRRAGVLELQADSTIFLEHLDLLPRRLQGRLARFLERGNFTPLGGRQTLRSSARLLCGADTPLRDLQADDRILPELARHFLGSEIGLPPLRERMEDFPEVLEYLLSDRVGPAALRRFELTPIAIHALMKHDWPGNLREVQSFVIRLNNGGYEGRLGVEVVDQLLGMVQDAPRRGIASERDLILDALRRHRFRRSETADFLRISRKTLYNKIRKYELLG